MRDLTPRIVLELLAHEGLVREAYRDSGSVWTWSVGVTNASGHRVYPRYKDAPQPIARCLKVYVWLLRTRYLPTVLATFGAYDPAEHELGAALSFHWNTGAISRASWVTKFLAGSREDARAAFLAWSRPPAIAARRAREASLLFDARWTGDGTAMVYEVDKPSYRPVNGVRQDLSGAVAALVGAPPATPAPAELVEPKPGNWFTRLFGG